MKAYLHNFDKYEYELCNLRYYCYSFDSSKSSVYIP